MYRNTIMPNSPPARNSADESPGRNVRRFSPGAMDAAAVLSSVASGTAQGLRSGPTPGDGHGGQRYPNNSANLSSPTAQTFNPHPPPHLHPSFNPSHPASPPNTLPPLAAPHPYPRESPKKFYDPIQDAGDSLRSSTPRGTRYDPLADEVCLSLPLLPPSPNVRNHLFITCFINNPWGNSC